MKGAWEPGFTCTGNGFSITPSPLDRTCCDLGLETAQLPPQKKNPLNLNALQLKTLTLFQELARSPHHGAPAPDGGTVVTRLPQPHGDHFHVGAAVASTRDATGLSNPGVWQALARKNLIGVSEFPYSLVLTPEGLDYDTGLADTILHRADH